MSNKVNGVSSAGGRDSVPPTVPSKPAAKHKPLRLIACRAALFVCSCFIALVLLELGVRVFLPRCSPSTNIAVHISHDGVPLAEKNFKGRFWRATGEYDVPVQINQYGFRDEKDLRDATEADYFVVGDSFSLGWGVAEEMRYSNLLDALLDVAVYNIAIPTNIEGYMKLLEYAKGQGAVIGHLIVGICMENDLQAYGNPNIHIPLPKGMGFWRVKSWLGAHFASYHAVISVVHQNALLRRAGVRLGIVMDEMPRQVYSEALIEGSCAKLAELGRCVPLEKMTVLIIPSRMLWAGNEKETHRKIHREFVKRLGERGFRVVDMMPVLEAQGNPMDYYFKYEGHWNDAGHKMAAEQLFRTLKHCDLESGPLNVGTEGARLDQRDRSFVASGLN